MVSSQDILSSCTPLSLYTWLCISQSLSESVYTCIILLIVSALTSIVVRTRYTSSLYPCAHAKRDLNRRFCDGLHSNKALSVPIASEIMTPLSTAAPIVRNPGQRGTFCRVNYVGYTSVSGVSSGRGDVEVPPTSNMRVRSVKHNFMS